MRSVSLLYREQTENLWGNIFYYFIRVVKSASACIRKSFKLLNIVSQSQMF